MNPDEKDAFAPDKTLRDQLLEIRSNKGGRKQYAEYEMRMREVVHGAVNETLRRMLNKPFADEEEVLLPPVKKSQIGHQERTEMEPRVQADLLEACFRLFQEGRECGQREQSSPNPNIKNQKLIDILLPHQIEGVKALQRIEERFGGAILADDMGLGKTIQAIALTLWAPVAHTLIVVPKSMVAVWEEALRKWAPDLRVVVHVKNRKTNHWKFETMRVVITTYDIMREEHGEFQAFMNEQRDTMERIVKHPELATAVKRPYIPIYALGWGRVIYDEAHRLRNRGTKTMQMTQPLRVLNQLLLTGTPFNNSFHDLCSYFKVLRVSPWNNEAQFARHLLERDGLHNWQQQLSERNKDRLAILSINLRAIMVRRKRDSLFDGQPVYGNPGSSTEVISIKTSPEEQRRQQETKSHWDPILDAERRASDAPKNAIRGLKAGRVLPAFTEARCAAVHSACPGAYAEHEWMDMTAGVNDADEVVLLGDLWDERSEQAEKEKTSIARQEFISHRRKDWKTSSKMNWCVEMAQKARNEGKKVLYFSEFQSAVDVLAAALLETEIPFLEYNGTLNKEQRQEAVEKFEGTPESLPDDITAMLLTSAGGEGITLVQATIVVIITPSWNPFVDLQMASRADRIGQKENVQIYHLINQESIELRVRRFQQAKMEKAEKVLSREAVNDALKHTQHWTKEIFMEKVKALGS